MIWLPLLISPYSAIIIIAWLYLYKKQEDKPGNRSKEDLPKVSVLIAARNEEPSLPCLISDLQKLDYPTDKLEVFIIDDHSTDRTAELIKEAYGMTYLLSSGKGKKQALATALKQSTGELILTTDADCTIPPCWILAHAEMYMLRNTDMVIGQVRTFPGLSLIKGFSDLEFYSLQAVSGGLALAGHPVMCNGANLGFRKEAVPDYPDAVRADIQSGDDMFLLHYMKKNKRKICWLDHAESIVETRMPYSTGSFLKQRSRWAGKAVFYKDIDTLIVALATLLGNLTLLASIILLFINTSFLLLAAGIYLLKTIPEMLLLAKYLKNPGKLQKLVAFIPLSLLYPVYVLVVGLVSIFRTNHW